MEKLAQRHALARRKAEEHAETMEIDDLVTSRHRPSGEERTWQ
jgi:hypothetical protein